MVGIPTPVDKAGNFYGTTHYGSSCPSSPSSGCGTVFKISPTGTETVIHSFQGGTDGAYPFGGVVMDATGNLYGTTYFGGGASCNGNGCGTVFKLASNGTETVLSVFFHLHGKNPTAGLLKGPNGLLYGTAQFGGTNKAGVVFSVKK